MIGISMKPKHNPTFSLSLSYTQGRSLLNNFEECNIDYGLENTQSIPSFLSLFLLSSMIF